MKFLTKFFINKKVRISVTVVAIVIAILYILTLFLMNNYEQIDAFKTYGWLYQLLEIFNQIILVAFSIITTTIFSSWLIEIKEKNKIYGDIICNDFFASPEFYNTLKEENRIAMLENLENKFYFNNSKEKEEMYKSIINRLAASEDIYYESCKYDIDCTVDGNLIRKKITRTTVVNSYEKDYKKNNLYIISSVYGSVESVQGFELESVKIDGKTIPLDNIEKIEKPVEDISLKKCGYTNSVKYNYKKSVVLNKSEAGVKTSGVRLEVTYKTAVPKSDRSYVCRVNYPCKNFSMNFRLQEKSIDKYELSAHPFGFVEKASTSTNGNRAVINMEFKDWIFQSNGIAVVLSEKN